MYSNGYNVYKNNSINYASKEQLLLMLVDGAVKFAKIARQAMVEKDIKKAHENVVKTEDIFIELMATLDTSAGQWAENMFAVYRFINEKLFEANMKKDVAIMDEVMPLIEDVRDIWYAAEEKARKGQ